MLDIQNIILRIDSQYPFINKVSVNDGITKSALHPAMKLGLAATLDNIEQQSNKRLVILTPKRSDYAIWLSFLTALWSMKVHFETEFQTPKVKKGSKVRLNNCVVEYDCEELAADGKTWMLWVQCLDGRYAFRLDREYTILPITTDRPLSKLKRVIEAYANAKERVYELDSILGIRTCGNLGLFDKCINIVSRKTKVEQFVEGYNLNDTSMKKLITWGKISKDGKPVNLFHDCLETNFPTCIVSSDMFRLSSFIEVKQHESSLQALIIDGVKFCEDNLQILDDYICHKNVPTVVVADYSERRSLKYLLDRDFKVLHINNTIMKVPQLNLQHNDNLFYNYDRYYRNSHYLTLNPVTIENTDFELLFSSLFNLEAIIVKDSIDHTIKEYWLSLLYIAIDFCKKWYPPPCDYFDNIQLKISSIRSQLQLSKMWISDELISHFDSCISNIHNCASSLKSVDNPKYLKIKHIIESKLQQNTLFLVSDENEGIAAAAFWSHFLADSPQIFNESQITCRSSLKVEKTNIEFIPVSQIEEKFCSSKVSNISICGWPGRDRFSNILSSFVAPNVHIFLYEAEYNWFKAAKTEWNKIAQIKTDASVLISAFNIQPSKINNDLSSTFESHPTDNASDDIYFRIRNHQLSRYVSSSLESEAILGRYVRFSDNRFSLMSDSHMHYVVNELVHTKSSPEIPKKRTEDLRVGDCILFMDSDRNIIRDIVDSWLQKKNKLILRETAALWRQSLMRKYDRSSRDLHQLSDALGRSGCTRTPVTLRKWLFDDDVIGPQDYDHDLVCIAEATGDANLSSKISEVKAAIANLRSLHLQAANLVREKCVAKLTAMIESRSIHKEVMYLDIENIKASILKIEEISNDLLRIKPSEVNRLHAIDDI